jgi:hypothetical protein
VNADAKHDQLTAVVQRELVAVTGPGGNQDAATVGVGECERELREVSRLPVVSSRTARRPTAGRGLGDRRIGTGRGTRLS